MLIVKVIKKTRTLITGIRYVNLSPFFYLTVVGTAFSRASGNLVKLNLTEVEAVKSFIDEQQPDGKK
jgi:hypothetical protein